MDLGSLKKSPAADVDRVESRIEPVQRLIQYTDSYETVKKLRKNSPRDRLRKIALDALGLISNYQSDAVFRQNRVQFLYIHHVYNDEIDDFRNLVKYLLIDHTIIPYSEAVNKVLTNKIDKPYICLSFDDGFKNNLRAAKILDEFNLKACFFVCPAIVGEKRIYRLTRFCEEKLHLPLAEFMDWNDLGRLLANGHEIGSHTMNHSDVATMSKAGFEDDLRLSLRILEKRCGNILHFAYPYGRFCHFTNEARQTVFNHGFQSCASAERGCHIVQPAKQMKENILIRRDHLILKWDLSHIKYFIRRNASSVALQSNEFKYHL